MMIDYETHWHRFRRAYAAFLGIGLGFCIAIMGLIAYDTIFHDVDDFIVLRPGVAIGYPAHDGTLSVRYQRGYSVKKRAVGEVYRRVVCTCAKTGLVEEYDLPPARREFDVGDYPPGNALPPLRYLDTPIMVPVGSQCDLDVKFLWRPTFGITAKAVPLDSFRFTVQEKP